MTTPPGGTGVAESKKSQQASLPKTDRPPKTIESVVAANNHSLSPKGQNRGILESPKAPMLAKNSSIDFIAKQVAMKFDMKQSVNKI